AAKAEDTTSGMGTVRKPALLFGGPNSGTPRSDDTSWRSTRTSRAEEVDSVDGETKALALAQPHAGGGHDQRSVPVGHSRSHCLDLAHRQEHDLGFVALGQHDADARRRCDEPVAHGALKIVDTHR
ncbi:MAG: hypothetical protein M3326_00850, partial [Actinomycetota bacterium]|nr:hypothetical protein [Actinomycetota bacterium]